MVRNDLDLDPADVSSTMGRLVSLDVDYGISAANVRGYLAIGIDHGIGDAHAVCEIVASLTRDGAPQPCGFAPPVPELNVANPLSTVARRIMAAAPADIASDIALELKMRMLRRGKPLEATTSTSDGPVRRNAAPAYAVAFVRSSPGYTAELRDFRNRHLTGISLSTLMFYAIRRSLEAGGIAVTDTTDVTTDLRRYLRPGESTLANLSTVATIASPKGQTLRDFAANLHSAVTSTYPATRALASAVLWHLRSKGEGNGQDEASTGGRVQLLVSDVSRLPSVQKLAFQPRSIDRIVAVAMPPARNSVTLCIVRLGDEIHVTGTYYPDVVSGEELTDALSCGLTLEPLLWK
jgi:hypothetical protein